VWELDLPADVAVVFVNRAGRGIVPEVTTMLNEGDDLMLVVPRPVRDETERRLRAVSRSGRLARFYGDRGET
jgi:cell volume regulation protein A